MEAKVVKAFGDATDGNRIYLAGEAYEACEARIAELEAKGFVERAAVPPSAAAMTAAQLRDMLAERGIEAPRGARKAELAALAGLAL